MSDGAGDEEVTPSQVADAITAALRSAPEGDSQLRRRLEEARDAVADGMPPDYVAALLYAAAAGRPG